MSSGRISVVGTMCPDCSFMQKLLGRTTFLSFNLFGETRKS
jgi:hypothetical protein